MNVAVDITGQDYADFNIFRFLKHQLTRTIMVTLLAIAGVQYLLYSNTTGISPVIITLAVSVVFCFYLVYYRLNKTKKQNMVKAPFRNT